MGGPAYLRSVHVASSLVPNILGVTAFVLILSSVRISTMKTRDIRQRIVVDSKRCFARTDLIAHLRKVPFAIHSMGQETVQTDHHRNGQLRWMASVK
jgi:hypothetical protein